MPRKRMLWVSAERMASRKGRSNLRMRGLCTAEKKVTDRLVAAAASVPASSTSSTALWTLCGESQREA